MLALVCLQLLRFATGSEPRFPIHVTYRSIATGATPGFVLFSRDGRRLLVSDDAGIDFVDVGKEKLRSRVQMAEAVTGLIEAQRDGQFIASTARGFYLIENGRSHLLCRIASTSLPVRFHAFNFNLVAASVGADHLFCDVGAELVSVNAKSGQVEATYPQPEVYYNGAVVSNGLLHLAGEGAPIFDIRTRSNPKSLTGTSAWFQCIGYAAKKQVTFLGGENAGLHAWRDTPRTRIFEVQLPQPADCLATSPDARIVAVGFRRHYPPDKRWRESNKLLLIDGTTGKRLTFKAIPTEGVLGLAFSPSGKILAEADRGGCVRLISIHASGDTKVAGSALSRKTRYISSVATTHPARSRLSAKRSAQVVPPLRDCAPALHG